MTASTAAHRTHLKVRFGELDPYNHVNHAVYVAYLEAGRDEALRSIGLGLDALAELGFQFVVADITVRFRRPAIAGDALVIETWLSEIGAVTSRWRQRILRGDDVLVESDLRAGTTGLDGRPKRLPADAKQILDALFVPD